MAFQIHVLKFDTYLSYEALNLTQIYFIFCNFEKFQVCQFLVNPVNPRVYIFLVL